MKSKLVLAPIRGITEHIYRTLFSKHFGGFDSAVAPFFSENQTKNPDKKILKEFNPAHDILPAIPQILSKNSEDFLPLANTLFEKGYEVINWNLGCPHPVVTSKNKGSGLLRFPDQIDRFLEQLLSKFKGKLSIKMRLGYESPEEIFKLIPILNRYPLTEIIIHARTAKQMYTGVPDKDSFEKIIPLIQHPLVYNGDVNSLKDFRQLSARFPTINKWMIGRGALKNPFLPGEIKGSGIESKEIKLKKIQQFHNELFSHYSGILSGDKHILDKMTEHWFYLSEFFPESGKLFRKIKKLKTLKDYQERLKIIFSI